MSLIVENYKRIHGRNGNTTLVKNELHNYYIYVVRRVKEDPTDLRAYIGLTRDYFNRREAHLKRFKRGYCMVIIFKKNMTMCEAEKYETQYINDYIEKGYKLFNKSKCEKRNRCNESDDIYLNDELYSEHEREKRRQARKKRKDRKTEM